MNNYLSSTSVILHVVGETECLLTEDSRKLLLLLDLLLVKDSAKLIERVLCVTAQCRDVLRGILPDVDGAGSNGRRCRAARIALDRHGDIRRKTFGVVDFIFLGLRHIFVVAVLMVGGTDALCTVIRLILQIAEAECAGREFVLVRRCLACNQAALKIGVLSDQEIKAAGSCKDTRLISCTPVVGGDISLAEGTADVGLSKGAGRYRFGRSVWSRNLCLCHVDIPRDPKARRGILLLIGLFLLERLNIEVPADSCRDLVSLHLAPEDVRILAGGDNRILLCTDEGRGVGGVGLLAVAFGSVYIDADVAESVYAKGCPDACGAVFIHGGGNARVFSCRKAHVPLGREGNVLALDGGTLDGEVAFCCGEICKLSCADHAARIFSRDVLAPIVGSARAEAEIERGCIGLMQGKSLLSEVVVDEAAGSPCIGGFQAIILNLADPL